MCSHASLDTSYSSRLDLVRWSCNFGPRHGCKEPCRYQDGMRKHACDGHAMGFVRVLLDIEKLTDCLYSVWRSSLILSFAACYLMWRTSISFPSFYLLSLRQPLSTMRIPASFCPAPCPLCISAVPPIPRYRETAEQYLWDKHMSVRNTADSYASLVITFLAQWHPLITPKKNDWRPGHEPGA